MGRLSTLQPGSPSPSEHLITNEIEDHERNWNPSNNPMPTDDEEQRSDRPCNQPPRIEAAPEEHWNKKVQHRDVVSACFCWHRCSRNGLPDAEHRHPNRYDDSKKHACYRPCRQGERRSRFFEVAQHADAPRRLQRPV